MLQLPSNKSEVLEVCPPPPFTPFHIYLIEIKPETQSNISENMHPHCISSSEKKVAPSRLQWRGTVWEFKKKITQYFTCE